MKHTKSIQELCSLLSRIENTNQETAMFLILYGYVERPDIIDPDAELIQTRVFVKFDATVSKEALGRVCEEQKEKGHPEIAVKAMELCHRLSNLEEEATGKNTQ